MNSLISLHRQNYPTDARSDDAITLWYHDAFPADFAAVPDAMQDYLRIQREAQTSGDEQAGFTDYAKQAAGEIIRGVPEAVGGLAKSADVAARALQRNLPLPAIQFGGDFPYVHYLDPAEKTAANEAGEATPLSAAGELSDAIGEKLSPAPVDSLKDSFWATKVPNTAGSIIGFMAGGGIAKAITAGSIKAVVAAAGEDAVKEAADAGLSSAYQGYVKGRAERAVQSYAAGVLGAADQALGAYQEAKSKGASDDDAFKAYLANLPVGAAYAIPVHELLPGNESGSKLLRSMRDIGIGGTTMGTQQVASNLIAKGIYDPERDPLEGVASSVGAGSIVTGALSALSHGLLGRTPPKAEGQPGVDPAKQYHLSEDQQTILSGLAKRAADGENTPELRKAILQNTSLLPDGTPNSIKAEASDYLQMEVQRISAEAQTQGEANAEREPTPAQSNGNVQQPEGQSQNGGGRQEVPANEGVPGVPAGGQSDGTVPAEAQNVPPVEANVTPKSLALESQKQAGWNPKWPFVPADFENRGFIEAIESDPTLSTDQRDRMFAAAERVLGHKIYRQPQAGVPDGTQEGIFTKRNGVWTLTATGRPLPGNTPPGFVDVLEQKAKARAANPPASVPNPERGVTPPAAVPAAPEAGGAPDGTQVMHFTKRNGQWTYTSTGSVVTNDGLSAQLEIRAGFDAHRNGLLTEARRKAALAGNLEDLKGGQKFRAYQGRGAPLEDIYGEEAVKAGRAVPILGKAEYYAPNPEDAKRYGTVTEHQVELQNPVVIDSDAGWRKLLDAAGTKVLDSRGREWYEHPERITGATEKLQRYLKAQGHDGAVIRLPTGADMNARGESTKALAESFGHSQVVKFEGTAPTPKPVAPEATRLEQARRAAAAQSGAPDARHSDRGEVPLWQRTRKEFLDEGLGVPVLHRRLIETAVFRALIGNGPLPPARVLADYPGIVDNVRPLVEAWRQDHAAKPIKQAQKAPTEVVPNWALQPEEYVVPGAKAREREQELKAHRAEVEAAVYRRLPVPEEVLRRYPELLGLRRELQQIDLGLDRRQNQGPTPASSAVWTGHVGRIEDLLGIVDFEGARPTSVEAGVGKKSAAAFTETHSEDELYKDHRAEGRDHLRSRKLGVFMAPDGSHVLVGTAYTNGTRQGITRYVSAFDRTGDPRAIPFAQLKKQRYGLIASIKTKDPSKHFLATYAPDDWNAISAKLRSEQRGVQATAAAVEEHMRQAGEGRRAVREGNRADETTPAGLEPESESAGVAATPASPVEFAREHAEAIHGALAGVDMATFESNFEPAISSSKRAVKAVEAALKSLAQQTGEEPEALYRILKRTIYENEKANRDSKDRAIESLHEEINAGGTRPPGEGGIESAGRGEGSETVSAGSTASSGANTGAAGPGAVAASRGEGIGERTGASPAARRVAAAESDVDTSPTEAQKKAGNYSKGHVTIDGLDVTLENAKGSVRSGTDANGKPWSVRMPATYGYLKGSEGHDGDHVDVYIGERPESGRVWVVDQIDPASGGFDEHKVLMGFDSQAQALKAYDGAFSDRSGPYRRGAVTEMSKDEFKAWLEKDTTEPVAYDADQRHEALLARLSARGEPFPGQDHLASGSDLEAMWDGALESARANGIDVAVLQGLHERGVSMPRAVALTVADPLTPSHDNVTLLFHELGHEVFRRLGMPSAMQEAFHRAIAKLAVPEGASPAVRADIMASPHRAEEVLVERTARNLVAEGFTPQDAQSLAQRVARLVQRLYYRSIMAIQRGLLGADHMSSGLAQKYFALRVRQFLAGDPSPVSFISFLGGPKLTAEQRGATFPTVHGGDLLPAEYDYGSGMNLYRPALGDTFEALQFNSLAARFSSRGTEEERKLAFTRVTDPSVISADYYSPANVSVDVAANNLHERLVSSAFKKVFEVQNPGLLSYPDFLSWLHLDGPPADKNTALNEQLIATAKERGLADWKPVEPTLTTDDLPNDWSRAQAENKAYRMAWALRSTLSEQRREADDLVKNGDSLMKQRNARLIELARNYVDMDLQLANARASVKDLLSGFNDDFRNTTMASHKAGVLTQTIEQIEGRKPDVALVKTVNRLYQQLTGNPDRFINTLQSLAGAGLDWATIPTRDAVDLVTKLIAPGHPEFTGLEKRSLAAIAVAYAKTNSAAMSLLELARSRALDDRRVINEAIRTALENTADAVTRARKASTQLPTLSKLADRLLTQIERLKDENYTHLAALNRAKKFIAFHDEAQVLMRSHMQPLETGVVGPAWEAVHGETYPVAMKPGATPEQVMANEATLDLKHPDYTKVIQHIQANRAWLESVPNGKRGLEWNTVLDRTNKLESIIAQVQHEVGIKQSALNLFLGPIIDKFESVGVPSLRVVAKQLRDYRSKLYTSQNDAEVMGTQWDAAMHTAMRAMGFDRAGKDVFKRVVYDAVHDFAEKNPDIFRTAKDAQAGFEAFLPRLRRFLLVSGDKDLRRTEDPKVWRALEGFLRADFSSHVAADGYRKLWGGKIREVMPTGEVVQREPVGAPFLTSMRTLAPRMARLYQGMRDAGWAETKDDRAFDRQRIADEFNADPAALDARLTAYMTPEIERDFLRTLTTDMTGRSAFDGVKGGDGLSPVALRENVQRAYEASGGSLVKFASALYASEEGRVAAPEAKGDFVAKTISGLHDYYLVLHNQFAAWDDNTRQGVGMAMGRRAFADARVGENLPGSWMEYRTHGRYDTHALYAQLAGQTTFGRRMEGWHQNVNAAIDDLQAKASDWDEAVFRVRNANREAKGAKLDALVKADIERQGKNYLQVKQAARNLAMVKSEKSNFENILRGYGGLSMEARPFVEALGSIAGMSVSGPVTALVHLPNLSKSWAKLGLGPTSMKVLAGSVKGAASTALGTLSQLTHGVIRWQSEMNARQVRAGLYDPDAMLRFRDRAVALGLADPTFAKSAAGRAVFALARGTRLALSSGIGKAKPGAENIYPTLKAQNLFGTGAQLIDAGLIHGWTKGFEDLVERAVDYFRAHPGDVADPAFRFKNWIDLGYSKGFLGIGSDERAFKYLYSALGRYGIDLESHARDVLARRAGGESVPAISDQQFRTLASLVQNEVTLESSFATRPSTFYTNPILRIASPLLGWSVAQSHDIWENARDTDLTANRRAYYNGFLPYLALVPAGIAIGVLRNYMQQNMTGKKPNRDEPSSFRGAVDSLAWAGTFGLGGDIYNAWLNRDTQRPFSLDNRVLFMSTLLNIKNSIENWVEQGSADYATVYRPLLQSLGGNGFLQDVQIMNHLTSADNAEARVTARINVGNILRVAGRELGMDVRVSTGGEVVSTPMRPLIGQMALAAYANDPNDFREAFLKAVEQAREQGEKDPARYVAQKFEGHNPLRSVFRTEPSQLEIQKIMLSLDDESRASVQNAVRLFNAYGQQVGVKPFFGRQAAMPRIAPSIDLGELRRRTMEQVNPPAFDLNEARRRAAGYSAS